MIATSGFETTTERTKFVFGRTPLGGLQRSPDPLASLRGSTSKGTGRVGKEKGEMKGKGRGEEGKEEEGRDGKYWPPFRKFLDPPLYKATVWEIE